MASTSQILEVETGGAQETGAQETGVHETEAQDIELVSIQKLNKFVERSRTEGSC